MQLKLAQYKDGKFQRFLELGKDFVYGGNFVGVYPQTALQAIKKCTIFSSDNFYKFQKDKKDSLNRFNGLFDGRTYGEGKFVLVSNRDSELPHLIMKPITYEEIVAKVKEILLKDNTQLLEKVRWLHLIWLVRNQLDFIIDLF